ncbi:tail fiber assembly protein, partial [Klebsiella pneumoniae]|uniref:tail fiber assembly protein n=1 Tax=Klebsiella pneumoniae TaxID=573 RepID=UPI003136073E
RQMFRKASATPVETQLPEQNYDEIVKQAEIEKSGLISQANDYIDSKQWPSKLALGRLKDDEKASFNEWLDYLDALESVDPSKACLLYTSEPTRP